MDNTDNVTTIDSKVLHLLKLYDALKNPISDSSSNKTIVEEMTSITIPTSVNQENLNDVDFNSLSFVNDIFRINKTIILNFDTKNKLTNFVSLYSNNEELNTLWIILHQLAVELIPYKSNEQKWLNSIEYPEFNTITSVKFLQQLKTLQNAII